MKIILANPRGFCAGVNMAIDSLERALQLFGTPLYVYDLDGNLIEEVDDTVLQATRIGVDF